MPRTYAQIKIAIWADDDFRRLTGAAQTLYFRLLTGATINSAGVADWRPKRIARSAADLTERSVRSAASELADHRFVVIDDDTEEILIRTFIRHDGTLRSPNQAAAVAGAYAGIGSPKIRAAITRELRRLHAEEPDLGGWSKALHLLDQDPPPDPSAAPTEAPSPAPTEAPTEAPPSDPSPPYPQPTTNNQEQTHAQPELIDTDQNDRSTATSSPPASPRSAAKRTPPVDDRFDTFWSIYPRKTAKANARKAWASAIKKTDPDLILAAVRRYAGRSSDPRYVAYPATWLNGERWDDADQGRTDRQPQFTGRDAWRRYA